MGFIKEFKRAYKIQKAGKVLGKVLQQSFVAQDLAAAIRGGQVLKAGSLLVDFTPTILTAAAVGSLGVSVGVSAAKEVSKRHLLGRHVLGTGWVTVAVVTIDGTPLLLLGKDFEEGFALLEVLPEHLGEKVQAASRQAAAANAAAAWSSALQAMAIDGDPSAKAPKAKARVA